eukprot:366278-Chlamydomonas_euryale.AAC.22
MSSVTFLSPAVMASPLDRSANSAAMSGCPPAADGLLPAPWILSSDSGGGGLPGGGGGGGGQAPAGRGGGRGGGTCAPPTGGTGASRAAISGADAMACTSGMPSAFQGSPTLQCRSTKAACCVNAACITINVFLRVERHTRQHRGEADAWDATSQQHSR